MLTFAGVKPIRESLFGLAFADEPKRARWLEDMRKCEQAGIFERGTARIDGVDLNRP